jgi:hypothetical protein
MRVLSVCSEYLCIGNIAFIVFVGLIVFYSMHSGLCLISATFRKVFVFCVTT